jgi:hypothetical protein
MYAIIFQANSLLQFSPIENLYVFLSIPMLVMPPLVSSPERRLVRTANHEAMNYANFSSLFLLPPS